MTDLTPRQRKQSTTRQQVVRALREDIAHGKLALGSRLPIRMDLEKRYFAGHMTMQRAVDELMRDGFVVSRGKLGTFVAESPAFVSTYALAFPFGPGHADWTRFWSAMVAEAATFQQSHSIKLPMFFNVLQEGGRNFAHFKTLVKEVEKYMVGGVIFATSPHFAMDTPLVQLPGVARVATAGQPERYPDFWFVTLSQESFVEKALDYMASRGRKRVAVLAPPGLAPRPGQADPYTEGARARGMKVHPSMRQYVWQAFPYAAEQVVSLMMETGPELRPDGLIICDDNLVEHAVLGLTAHGVKLAEDMDVVAHANFPVPASSPESVRRLGYRAGDILGRCVEAIQRQRAGERKQQILVVDAVWE